MHRNYLIGLLESYHPEDPQEVEMKNALLKFVRGNAMCFERSLEEGHVTASCWLLNCVGSHALLMHHAKIGKWIQPGGHCDGDPDVVAVAMKEAREESGIEKVCLVRPQIFDLDIHVFPAGKDVKEHLHYDVRFLLQAVGDDTLVQNGESNHLLWVGKEDSLPTDSRSIVRMYEKWISLY